MFGSFSQPNPSAEALARVRAWTQERFALESGETVLATQIACSVPGCPPLETVVSFWTRDGRRHHFKVFKPAAEVTQDDLPYSWLKRALAAVDGDGCDCC